jgi:hypothetical protein
MRYSYFMPLTMFSLTGMCCILNSKSPNVSSQRAWRVLMFSVDLITDLIMSIIIKCERYDFFSNCIESVPAHRFSKLKAKVCVGPGPVWLC